MTAKTTERQLTQAEIELLTPRRTGFPRSLGEFRRFSGLVVYFTFMLSLFGVLLWLAVNWLAGLVVSFDFGWNSAHRRVVSWSIIAAALAYSVIEVQRTSKPTAENIRSLQADIDAGKVIVEEHSILEVKVLQEEEHGGLFYFLLTSDNRVYVALDYESQDLGVDGEDPMSSTFRPKSILRVEVTPHSRWALGRAFAGKALPVPEPVPMTASPQEWPEPDEFVDVPWANIEEIYSG